MELFGYGRYHVKTLREWRRERLLSLAELAAKAGVTEKTVGEIERGRVQPHLRTIRRLAEALSVEPVEVEEFVAVIRGTT